MSRPEQLLYLDNNATTAIDPAVLESMRPFLEEFFANPSSGYGFAAQVREAIEEVAAIAREKKVPFHTDAVQAAGKIEIKLGDVPLQFLSISGHKLHGPKGVGALYVNRHARFRPLLLGGSHENNRRAGTENTV